MKILEMFILYFSNNLMETIAIAISIVSLICTVSLAIFTWHKSRANYWIEFIKFSPESTYESEVKKLEEKLKDGKYSILRVDKQSEHGNWYIATLIKIKK